MNPSQFGGLPDGGSLHLKLGPLVVEVVELPIEHKTPAGPVGEVVGQNCISEGVPRQVPQESCHKDQRVTENDEDDRVVATPFSADPPIDGDARPTTGTQSGGATQFRAASPDNASPESR